ncbi:MAG: M16 family metallopeptidase [Gemmatimonadota bacterium]
MRLRTGASLLAVLTAAAVFSTQSVRSQDSARQARETPPAPGTPRPFRVPPRRTITLPNGMKLTMVPWGRIPKAAIELEIRTGSVDEGPSDVSLSSLTADMLLEGTITRSSQDLSTLSADMGGGIDASSGAEAVGIGGEVLSDHVARYIALVADVARNPRFDSADLSRIINKHVRDNAISISQPGSLAQKKFREIAYGDHPFARILPDEPVVRAFNVERVRDFHARNYGAARAHLYVSGIFDARLVERAVRDAFESWAGGSPPTVNPPRPVARRQVELIDRPGSVQSSMWMGLPVADPSSPDWLGLTVTDALLGGTFGSRITANIREARGYTYSPYSFLWSRKASAHWVEVADVTTEHTGASITEIFNEMNRLRAEAPSEPELTGIKNIIAGVFTLQNSSRNGLIGQLQFIDLHGLGDDYLRGYVNGIHGVTPAQVQEMARKHLDPARVSMAIVGDRKLVDPQLGTFRPVVP